MGSICANFDFRAVLSLSWKQEDFGRRTSAEEEDEERRQSPYGKVDIETPSPGDLLGKNTTEQWPNDGCNP